MTLEQHCSVSQTSITFFCISVTLELRLSFCVLWCLWWSSCVPPPFAQGLHHQKHHGITRIIMTLSESLRHQKNRRRITRIIVTPLESSRHHKNRRDIPESSRHHQNHYGITRNIVTLPESSKHHQNHHGITRIIVTPLESSWHHKNRRDITRIIRILRNSLESSTL